MIRWFLLAAATAMGLLPALAQAFLESGNAAWIGGGRPRADEAQPYHSPPGFGSARGE